MTEDLTSIDGVGPAIADQLRDGGFETVDDVQGADVDELADVHLIGEASARAILGGDDDAHGGRPSKLDDVRDDLLDAAERGTTKEGCARAAGIATSTLYDWLDQFPEFSEAFNRARAKAEQDLVEAAVDDDPKWVLERSYGYVKTERREIEADVDQTTTRELGDEEKDLALEALRQLQEAESE